MWIPAKSAQQVTVSVGSYDSVIHGKEQDRILTGSDSEIDWDLNIKLIRKYRFNTTLPQSSNDSGLAPYTKIAVKQGVKYTEPYITIEKVRLVKFVPDVQSLVKSRSGSAT